MATVNIWYPAELRALWPERLADEWRTRYPGIFDDDDLRQTSTQPEKHFLEWFTAVHIFHSTGYLSLVEKAQFGGTHRRKQEILDKLLTSREQERLRAIGRENGAQWPDLFVYREQPRDIWFAEVKRPDEAVRAEQAAVQRAIASALGFDTHEYRVSVALSGSVVRGQ